jgi:hypothetical protein
MPNNTRMVKREHRPLAGRFDGLEFSDRFGAGDSAFKVFIESSSNTWLIEFSGKGAKRFQEKMA